MTPELSTALTLLVIGMVTVFLVLLLVVTTGNLLISFASRYGREEPGKAQNRSSVSAAKVAEINAAVEIFTEGKGSVIKIEKVE